MDTGENIRDSENGLKNGTARSESAAQLERGELRRAFINEQRLKTLVANINDGVAVSLFNNSGGVEYVFVTDRYYELLGFTREQYRNEVSDPFDLIYTEDAAAVKETATAMRDVGESRMLCYRAVRRDGRVIWLKVVITVMTFPDVDRPALLSVFSDITDLMEAEKQLREQHSQINELINMTPCGISVVEMDTERPLESLRTIYFNDYFYTYSGYDRYEYGALRSGDELRLVFDEDRPALVEALTKICQSGEGVPESVEIRCHTKEGGYRWLMMTGKLAQRNGNICTVNVVQVDITKRKIALDRQRISEEMFRIAAEADNRAVVIFDVKAGSCRVESRMLFSAKYGEIFENVPESLIEKGIVSSESADTLRSVFSRIRLGEQQVSASLLLRTGESEYRWFECNAQTVFNADCEPDRAVLVFHDITQQRVKEAVYKKWQLSIEKKSSASYTMYRCSLGRDAGIDEQSGGLLRVVFAPETKGFNARTKEYVEQYVCPEDRESFSALINSATLLDMFHRGENTAALDYRELGENDERLWRRITVEMVEYMDSTDIQAFLLFENIDEQKRSEIKAREMEETDLLTGTLNRAAYTKKADALLESEAAFQHALFLMDMDDFNRLNDALGPAAGDKVLSDAAAVLRSLLRQGDLICRFGGDEFLVLLRDIPYDAAIEKKARQICELMRQLSEPQARVSVSVGIAVYPRDGRDTDSLYRSAAKALDRVKKAGKDDIAFYDRRLEKADSDSEDEAAPDASRQFRRQKKPVRRMLIADDSEPNRALLCAVFEDDFNIVTAVSGRDAINRLRHFGASLSVVLLDLKMPDCLQSA